MHYNKLIERTNLYRFVLKILFIFNSTENKQKISQKSQNSYK